LVRIVAGPIYVYDLYSIYTSAAAQAARADFDNPNERHQIYPGTGAHSLRGMITIVRYCTRNNREDAMETQEAAATPVEIERLRNRRMIWAMLIATPNATDRGES
jgi:hypothetical protein